MRKFHIRFSGDYDYVTNQIGVTIQDGKKMRNFQIHFSIILINSPIHLNSRAFLAFQTSSICFFEFYYSHC